MLHPFLKLSFLLALLSLLIPMAAAALESPPDPTRVREIAAMLPDTPRGPGPTILDRAAWETLAAQPAFQGVVARAASLLKQPIPDQPDDLFLEFSRTGNRTHWQAIAGQRRGRLVTLALAECLENRGQFLPAIEEIIRTLCAERTWVMPAHDGKLANFKGETVEIDLGSSALGWNMAAADWLLGDRLSPAVRSLLRENLRHRILDPYHAMITGQSPPNWWLKGTNNWNAVCLAGVTGTGLAEIPSREGRAEIIAAAEKYTHFFLSGFTPDGYCSEGLGYWNYGFGHYVLLSETVRRATGGQVDLLARPEARAPALFGARIQIINGVSPAFADCAVNAQPSAVLMHFVNQRFGLGLQDYQDPDLRSTTGSLFETMIYGFPQPTAPAAGGSGALTARLRDWFDQAGILIARPAPGAPCRLGVALKGGNNAENHNHNDVGSYVVVSGERPVLLDPGPETYTARTFSSRRYESKLLNSFGHDVPLVAGKLQREGHQAQGRVLRTDFTPAADTLQFEIASAYPVPELKSLKRTFVYSREGTGALSVVDQAEFTSPRSFGTALITLGTWKQQPDGSLAIYDGDQALRVEINTGGSDYSLDPEEIHEDAPVTPTRIGINLKQPAQSPAITLKITPLPLPDDGKLLRNGSFESGTFGWEIARDGLGAISTEQAAAGTSSLKITDHNIHAGSNITSTRIPATAGHGYLLRGKIFQVSGEGIGMYIKFDNSRREPINPIDSKGNISPVGIAKGAPGHWEPFSFQFQAPPGAATMQLWIHSFTGAESEAYLDDLEIIPEGE